MKKIAPACWLSLSARFSDSAVAPTIWQSRPFKNNRLKHFFLFRLKFKVSLSSTQKNLFKNTLEIHVYSAKSPKITTESTNMRSDRKARISGLTGTEHARNRTLPDLPSVWPWEIWVRDYNSSMLERLFVHEEKYFNTNPPLVSTPLPLGSFCFLKLFFFP